MKATLCRFTIIATAIMLPVFYFIDENPFDSTSFLSLEEKEMIAWQRARMQIKPGETHHLKTFKNMQKSSELLKNVNTSILIGAPPMEKSERAHRDVDNLPELLTLGISSMQRPQGSYLLDTLQSLFSASSLSEQKHFLVLVHLADPDPKWLDQMISNISTLFKPYIQARQLVVINTPLKSYLPLTNFKKNFNDTPTYAASHSKQNKDYAFLMNVAINRSDYFLMIEDDVKCVPGFVTQIAAKVYVWQRKPWVTLEFSHLDFTGKLFRTRDLPHFVSFLLLFHQQMSCNHLLSHFHDIFMQQKPIRFSPSLFQHLGNYSSFEGKFNGLKDKEFEPNDIGSPSNPPATIYTSLNVTNASVMNAYSLDKNFLYSEEAKVGSHLTIVLDKPAIVFRVQVLTGSEVREENQLKEGQVELGFDSTNRVTDCDDYILLGFLANGTLNKAVLSEESEKVKCVRLLVTATLPSGLICSHSSTLSLGHVHQTSRHNRGQVSKRIRCSYCKTLVAMREDKGSFHQQRSGSVKVLTAGVIQESRLSRKMPFSKTRYSFI
ncbi:alpha-1,6-mannosyl-glycoprotein 4-beta-N-acetylglucosaminyltransferase-like isoform X1 [Tupaia chinensis]|uniref:alpha-1,6-mannosyl-glycoprotein 4-beta-N-acetylglucosaminyltransferase-like isoform X1 n=1 Tax=Tupaia chinensis TaxID=246437 RepID=UPI000FFCC030|nr:alpha-1,6-mannosyl-glycoprotein 4-beta-N-acetylglucosaminyltransferase-like isoform X1 [Tupaia chinensis]XP_027631811.1 alpha-1,6-mannosyl-glycoprotein 4-beta-N-acetylglucosaminyltransferase-like isoform X1 [Tupaia chinensis]XP_027631812.1 alpha-1,6-mannosyl-glycoprotein 4-beta-N-acetylglucosaminyltransferase-like isoform X1 [Tupaia chinensis]